MACTFDFAPCEMTLIVASYRPKVRLVINDSSSRVSLNIAYNSHSTNFLAMSSVIQYEQTLTGNMM